MKRAIWQFTTVCLVVGLALGSFASHASAQLVRPPQLNNLPRPGTLRPGNVAPAPSRQGIGIGPSRPIPPRLPNAPQPVRAPISPFTSRNAASQAKGPGKSSLQNREDHILQQLSDRQLAEDWAPLIQRLRQTNGVLRDLKTLVKPAWFESATISGDQVTVGESQLPTQPTKLNSTAPSFTNADLSETILEGLDGHQSFVKSVKDSHKTLRSNPNEFVAKVELASGMPANKLPATAPTILAKAPPILANSVRRSVTSLAAYAARVDGERVACDQLRSAVSLIVEGSYEQSTQILERINVTGFTSARRELLLHVVALLTDMSHVGLELGKSDFEATTDAVQAFEEWLPASHPNHQLKRLQLVQELVKSNAYSQAHSWLPEHMTTDVASSLKRTTQTMLINDFIALNKTRPNLTNVLFQEDLVALARSFRDIEDVINVDLVATQVLAVHYLEESMAEQVTTDSGSNGDVTTSNQSISAIASTESLNSTESLGSDVADADAVLVAPVPSSNSDQ